MQLLCTLLLLFLACHLATPTPIFDRDGVTFRGGQSNGFKDTIQDWFRVLKNRVVDKWHEWFGNKGPTPSLSAQDILNIDKTFETEIRNYLGPVIDLRNGYDSDDSDEIWDIKSLIPISPTLEIDLTPNIRGFAIPGSGRPSTTTPKIEFTTLQRETPQTQVTQTELSILTSTESNVITTKATVIPTESTTKFIESTLISNESTVLLPESTTILTKSIVTEPIAKSTEPIIPSTESIATSIESINSTESMLTAASTVITIDPTILSTESIVTSTEPIVEFTESITTSTEPIVEFTESIMPSTESIATFTESAVTSTEAILTSTESSLISTEPIVTEVISTFTEEITITTELPTSTELTLPVLNKRIEDNETIDKHIKKPKNRPASAEVIF